MNCISHILQRLMLALLICNSVSAFAQVDSVIVDTLEEFSDLDWVETEDTVSRIYFKHHPDKIFLYHKDANDSIVSRWQKEEDFAYANTDWVTKKKETHKLPFYYSKWFVTLIWILIIAGFIALIIWFLTMESFRLFRKAAVNIAEASGEELPEDIFSINFENAIHNAVKQGNFRLATRLHYLSILKDLNNASIIEYRPDKTNFDYLMQVLKTPYYKDFSRVMRNYEFAWYGHFDPGQTGYELIRKESNELSRRIRPV